MPINERNASNFKNKLRDTLKDAEDFIYELYYDTNKIATIGCGFNVTLKDILQKVCDKKYSDPKMDEKEFTGLLNTINGVEVKTNENLRSKVSEYLDSIKTEDGKSAKFGEFNLDDKQIGDILPEVVEIFRDGLNKKLAYTSISPQESKIDENSIGSNEYIALMSMTYNNPSLVGDGLKARLRARNRFGAWYEIRYKSNGDNNIGIAKRRFIESNEFGLFESNENNEALNNNALTNISINAISFEECLDLFSLLNVAKIKEKDEPSITYLQNAIAYETTKEFKGNRTIAGYSRGNADFNTHYRKYNTILQFFADKINALLKDVTSKTFKLEDIYVITTKDDNSHNISRINKLLKIRAENGEFRPEAKRDILLIYPTASALPVMPIQPKNTTFTIVLADNTSLDCSNLNPDGNSNESEIVLMNYKQDVREPNKNSRDEEISFIKPSTNGETIIYKNANGIFISQDEGYAFNSGNVITLNFFEKMNFNLLNFAKENSYSIRSDKASSMFDIKLRLPDATDSISTKNEGNFNLVVSDLIIEDEEGKSSDIKEVYLHNGEDKRVYPSYYLKKNDDKDVDSNSSSENSYTAKFRININLDKNSSGFKKTSKFIIATFDLSKRYDTGEIHAKEDTAVVTLASKDKKDGGAEFDIKVSTVVYQKNITEIRLNTSESSDATNLSIKDTLNLEAVYLPNKGDDDYKEISWAYKVIREDKYNSEVMVDKVAGAINLSEEKFKGKKITFSPKDDIKDKELLKRLNHGNHIIMFFAYLRLPAFKTKFGKTHIRVDIKAPIYLKYSNGKLCIYEFGHTDATMCFDTSLSGGIFDKESKDEKVEHMPKGVYYINSNLSGGDIDIYEDDKLSETCYQSIDGKDRSYVEPCKIYVRDSNIQRVSSTKSGINLIDSENKNRFIQKFNEVKQRVGLDSKEVKLEVG
ncbi:hypothetical protein [Campylobacter concisus]|uniref:Uncharacterized protein n=1 Tax=Campylobacter concisus TaxID=199 RepID=A0A7S9RED3_9BACT|nr:hypothetical protein [Campylobacter concisus]QPH90231.1 hypothetical protein CVT00_01435 [Campylobacter concisus]